MLARSSISGFCLIFTALPVLVAGSTTSISSFTPLVTVAATPAVKLSDSGSGGGVPGGKGPCPIGGNYIKSLTTPPSQCWERPDYSTIPYPYPGLPPPSQATTAPPNVAPPVPSSSAQLTSTPSTGPSCPLQTQNTLNPRAKRPTSNPQGGSPPNKNKKDDGDNTLCKGKGTVAGQSNEEGIDLRKESGSNPNYDTTCKSQKGTVSYVYHNQDSKNLDSGLVKAANRWAANGSQKSPPDDDQGQCDHNVEIQWFKNKLKEVIDSKAKICPKADGWEEACTILRRGDNAASIGNVINRPSNLHGLPLTVNQLKARATSVTILSKTQSIVWWVAELGSPISSFPSWTKMWSDYSEAKPTFNYAKSYMALDWYLGKHKDEAKQIANDLQKALNDLFVKEKSYLAFDLSKGSWGDDLDSDWEYMRAMLQSTKEGVNAAVKSNCGENPTAADNVHKVDDEGCCADGTAAQKDGSAPKLWTAEKEAMKVKESCCHKSTHCCKGAPQPVASTKIRRMMLSRPSLSGLRRDDDVCKKEEEEEEDGEEHSSETAVAAPAALVTAAQAGAGTVGALAAGLGIAALAQKNKTTKGEVHDSSGKMLIDLVNNEFKPFVTDPKNHNAALNLVLGAAQSPAYDALPGPDTDGNPYEAILDTDDYSISPVETETSKTACDWIRETLQAMLTAANIKQDFLPACPKP